jgi:hypothetical protein
VGHPIGNTYIADLDQYFSVGSHNEDTRLRQEREKTQTPKARAVSADPIITAIATPEESLPGT